MKQKRIFFKSMETKRKRFLGKATGLLLLLLVCFGNAGYVQSNSATGGREFYITYTPSNSSSANLQLKVVVERACFITAEYNNQPGTYWKGWNNTWVAAGIYTDTVILANVYQYGTPTVTSKSIRLTSSEDVCVYAVNYRTMSSDATCILPVSTWGKNFFAFPVRTPNGNGNWGGGLAIVANNNGTEVTVSGAFKAERVITTSMQATSNIFAIPC